MSKLVRLLPLMVVFALAAPGAFAERERVDPEDMPWSRGRVAFGGFLNNLNSGFRLGASNVGLGIELDVEKFLGLDQTVRAARLDGNYRLTRNLRHNLDFSWFKMDRSGTNVLLEEVELPNGETLIPGTEIESVFNFDILKLRYEYSFLMDERINMTVGGGFYVMPIEFGLGKVGEDISDEAITAPLPVVSFGFDFALTPKWLLTQDIDFLYFDIMDVQGSILDLKMALERDITKHFGLGLGYEALRVSVEAGDDDAIPGIDFVGNVNFEYRGIMLFVRGEW